MQTLNSKITTSFLIQIFLFLFVNELFIFKYVSRVESVNAFVVLAIYMFILLSFLWMYLRRKKLPERFFQIAFRSVLILASVAIAGLLFVVDPLSVNVDRWSAVTFFLDGLFRGEYPYAIHTHMSETNYPSPFPVWYLINLPFYLLKDVGLGLIFFLWLTAFCVRYFSKSYEKSFLFLFLLCISPAYWWEVVVRSDSLSNAFLIFCFILWFSKRGTHLSNNFGLTILMCGFLASTRLSAVLPIALFFFRPYLNLSWQRKIIFPVAILGIVFLTFSPFIFWDTNTWIFFSRNPFMSETSVGNIYVLTFMMLIGCVMAYRWHGMKQFFNFAALFIFLFILSSQTGLVVTRGVNGTVFTDLQYDISYFSLLLPYCLISLSDTLSDKAAPTVSP